MSDTQLPPPLHSGPQNQTRDRNTHVDDHTRRHTRERTIENYFVSACEKRGLFTVKFTAPSTAGVPDRIVAGFTTTGDTEEPASRTVFVELKRPGGQTRPLQDATIAQMRSHGCLVDVADSQDGVDDLLTRWFGPPPNTPEAPASAVRAQPQTPHGHLVHAIDPFDLSA